LPRQNEYDIYPGWTGSFKYRLWSFGFDTSQFSKAPLKDGIKIRWGMDASYLSKNK